MPVTVEDAEAYELPDLGSTSKPYLDEQDQLDEADRLLAEQDDEDGQFDVKRASRSSGDGRRRSFGIEGEEEILGKGDKIDALIARVGPSFCSVKQEMHLC
jgi:hypothetical protein